MENVLTIFLDLKELENLRPVLQGLSASEREKVIYDYLFPSDEV